MINFDALSVNNKQQKGQKTGHNMQILTAPHEHRKSEDHLPGDPRYCRCGYFISAITAHALTRPHVLARKPTYGHCPGGWLEYGSSHSLGSEATHPLRSTRLAFTGFLLNLEIDQQPFVYVIKVEILD